MIYYEVGAVRWRRLVHGDPRGYRANSGWDVEAQLIDNHPITGKPLKMSQWWIR